MEPKRTTTKRPKVEVKFLRRKNGWTHAVTFVNGRQVQSMPIYRWRD